MAGIINKQNKNYPELLKEIGKEAPSQIYYKGDWPLDSSQNKNGIFENCLAVVGSRQLTSYGRRATEYLVRELSVAGITIVSGFMYGGDETAHLATVKTGGKTIAVMPCGIDLIHPKGQEKLYYQILENKGLIISEFEGKFPPEKWTYPKRNRIVAGLSKAILVIEAGLKSGTMITADYAKKFRRKIFVVPGSIFSSLSKGNLKLIKEGATPVDSAKDILDYFQIRPAETNDKNKTINSKITIEQKVIEKLKRETMTVDELVRSFNMPISEISVILSMMQLKGMIDYDGFRYHIN